MNRPAYTFTVWDWDSPWHDLELFRKLMQQLAAYGFTGIELGVPWGDLDATDERVAIAEAHGLQLRLRVNLQDPPQGWPHQWSTLASGEPLNKGYGAAPHGLPSWFDEAGVEAQAEWLVTLAQHYRGRGYDYTLGIGLHFELKYGAWTGYEPAGVESYARWLDGDKADANLLLAGWDAAVEPGVPGPERLGGALDASGASWIAFREHRARTVVDRLTHVIREHDPSATVSAPLGEGFRSESAEFGNQDIVGLSASADSVVFSYDFYLHAASETHELDAMMAVYRSLTGKPIHLELDGMDLFRKYGDAAIFEYGIASLDAGAAGVNVANLGEWAADLSVFPYLARLGAAIAARSVVTPPEGADTLIVLPARAFYADRSGAAELVHEAAVRAWQEALTRGTVAFATEENLAERLPARTVTEPDGIELAEASRRLIRERKN